MELTSTESSVYKKGQKMRVGNRDLVYGKSLITMKDSSELYHTKQYTALRERLERDGFILVRKVLTNATALGARNALIQQLYTKNAVDKKLSKAKNDNNIECGRAYISKDPKTKKLLEGWTVDAESGGVVGGREDDSSAAGWAKVGNSAALTNTYNGKDIKIFYSNLFGYDNAHSFVTFPNCTWLRMRGQGEVTAEHADYYYFKGHTHIFSTNFDKKYFKHAETVDANQKDKDCQRCWQNNPTNMHQCDICKRSYHEGCLSRYDKKGKGNKDHMNECSMTGSSMGMSMSMNMNMAKCNVNTNSAEINKKCPTNLPMDMGSMNMSGMSMKKKKNDNNEDNKEEDKGEWHCDDCANSPYNFYTCWMALGDVSGKDGALCLIGGSHRLQGYDAPIRGDLLPSQFTPAFERKSVWQTFDYMNAGDVILFNIKTVHAASKNTSPYFRISLDTRVACIPLVQTPEKNSNNINIEVNNINSNEEKTNHNENENSNMHVCKVLETNDQDGNNHKRKLESHSAESDVNMNNGNNIDNVKRGNGIIPFRSIKRARS